MDGSGLYPQLFVRFRLLELEDLLLLGAILLLPWGFGGVPVYAYRSAAFLIVLALFLTVARRGPRALHLDKLRWTLPALLLVAWGFVQLVPLPPSLMAVISPQAHEIYSTVFPGYGEGGPERPVFETLEAEALERLEIPEDVPLPPREDTTLFVDAGPGGRWEGWRPISLMPHAGFESIMWYLALLAGFVLVSARAREPDMADQYRAALFMGFMVMAFIGLVHAATSGPGNLLWLHDLEGDETSHPFGPYVNPNNFAAVMELAVPWLAGYTLMRLRRHGRRSMADLKTPIFAVGTLLCLAAGVAAGSKFSAPAMAVTLSVLILFAAPRGRRLIASGGLALAWIVGGLIAMQTLLGERLREYVTQFGLHVGEIDRVVAWKSAWAMISDYWSVGCGFGASADVFSRYIPRGEFLRWEEIHNDYLEVFAEGGIVAVALVVWLTLAFWRRAAGQGALRTSRGNIALEQLGLLLGLASLSLHALVDFNHQIPANALLFVTLAALAWVRGSDPSVGGS